MVRRRLQHVPILWPPEPGTDSPKRNALVDLGLKAKSK
jgi:hypothetical protein